MELDAWRGVRGQRLGGVGGQAVKCEEGQVPMVLAGLRFHGQMELGRKRSHRVERVSQGPTACQQVHVLTWQGMQNIHLIVPKK